ncbi:MAG: DnaJ domain-containing protein [Gemmatimonadetes bacterium]|nr:DnaJ domain-containing protein [Gemmatimonadota bacterium]NNM03950.1 DnaJ domain-containing protein [Gemmatimonadota bacterium]
MSPERFFDYYEILQVNPNADPDTIDRVFRLLAKRHHPDNKNTGNAEKFTEVSEAYHVLSDPEARAKYDARYDSDKRVHQRLFFEAPMSGESEDERTQRWILSVLYTARRQSLSEPGLGVLELEHHLGFPDGHLDFHLWYLKEKGWIGPSQSGRLAITVDGVDWICKRDRLIRKDRLIEESAEASGPQDPTETSEDGSAETLPPQTQARSDEETAA